MNLSSKNAPFWDDSYTFYLSLSEKKKEMYWKESNRLIDLYFFLILICLEILLLLKLNQNGWIFFILGSILSTILIIIKSSKIQKKYK